MKAVGAGSIPSRRTSTGARRWCRRRLPIGAGVPAVARRLRRRRLGGAGLRGHRRPPAACIRGTTSSCRGRGARARCPARTPSRPARCRARSRPADEAGSTSSAAGPSWPPWAGPPKASTNGAAGTSTGWPELESGWPEAVRGPDTAPLRRALRQPARHRRWRRVRRLAARVCRHAGLRPGGLGAVGDCWRAGPLPRSSWLCPASAESVDRDVLAVLVAAFSGFLVEHSLRPPPPGLPTLRPFQAAQGAVALDWLRRLTGW